MASSSEPKEIDLTDEGDSGTPGKKKLKQMRLPFKIIDKNEVKTKPNTDTPSSDKKRKISDSTAAEDTTTPSKKERTDDGPAEVAPVVRGETAEKKTPKRITPIPVPRDDSSPVAAKTPKRIKPTLISSSPSVRPPSAEPHAQGTPKAKKRIALQPADDPAPPPSEKPEQETKEVAAAAAASPSSCSVSAEDKQPLSPEVVLSVGDKIKVFYKDDALYEAKIIKWRKEDGASCQFLVHYQGWNARFDEWIERGRIAELGWSKAEEEDKPSETPTTPTPPSSSASATSSPAVIEDRKKKMRVAIAKLKVTIHELNDEMDAAAEKREFLKAAEVKAKIDARSKEREELEGVLDKSGSNVGKMEAALKEIANSTPKSSVKKTPSGGKKRAALSVATPGCSGSAPTTPKTAQKPTPKQSAKKEEAAKKKEERERVKAEKDKQKAEEKLANEKKRDEEKAKREAEKKAKEEEKLEKERLREEEKTKKERLKEEEKTKKEQEKKAKEEERLEKQRQKSEEQKLKQEEKDRKAEEKRRQEEAENAKAEKAKAKAKAAFSNFFVKKSPEEKSVVAKETAAPANDHLSKFIVGSNMRLPPASRSDFGEERRIVLHKALEEGVVAPGEKLYLSILKSGGYEFGRSGKTWPSDEVKKDEDDGVEIIDEDEDDEEALLDDSGVDKTVLEEGELKPKRVRAKLLQFTENQRPPYWGTWSKRSKCVGPRKPFGQDKELFDYEYESDDDWEEEPAGESLSDDEKDKEDEEEEEKDEEEDDGFFVGHGVLDKDEIMAGDDDDDDGEVIEFDEDLEIKKQKMRAQQFEEEYKNKNRKKKKLMKKRVFGPMWMGDHETGAVKDRGEIACEQLIRILKPYRAISLVQLGGQIPTARSSPAPSPSEAAASAKATPKSGKKKKEKDAVGEGTPKSSKKEEAAAKRKEERERVKAEKEKQKAEEKLANDKKRDEEKAKSSIKTLISNIPVKRRIKPVPVSDPAQETSAAAEAARGEDEVEIIKEIAKDKVTTDKEEVTKASKDITKAKENGQEKEKASIKSFFSTIPVKRKAMTSPAESEDGGLAKQTRSEANKEEGETGGGGVEVETKRDDQKES